MLNWYEYCSYSSMLVRGSFAIDLIDERAWFKGALLVLKPKTFAVLSYLAQHSDRLVRKEELLDAIWPDAHVGEAVLKTQIKELRQALGDTGRSPRIIETVHRRGYRLAAPDTKCDSSKSVIRTFVARIEEFTSLDAAFLGNLLGALQERGLLKQNDAGWTLPEAETRRAYSLHSIDSKSCRTSY